MKVGLVVPGGVDRSGEFRVIPALLWLIERLARAHEVHVFALHQEPGPSSYGLLGATVHNIGRSWTRARAISAILAHHRRGAFSLLHGFWATPPGVIAVTAGRILGRPVLLHLAGGELVAFRDIRYGGFLTTLGRFSVRLAMRGATRVTAASGQIIDAAGKLGVRAECLPLGVDLGRWPVREPRRRNGTRPARLVHVASLNMVKDQGALLRAAASMARSGQPFHLDIIGEDTLGGRTQRMAADLGLSEHVTFHGFVTQRRLRPLMEAADLLLLSSRHEAGPVVVLEAAATGVPTVGTAVGHVRDWSPEAAVGVAVGDDEALARETRGLLADEDWRLRIAKAAQSRAVHQDADWTARRVLALYDEITSRAHA